MIHHCSIFRKDTGEIVQSSYFSCPDDDEQVARNFYGRLQFFGTDEYDYIDEELDSSIQYIIMTNGRYSVSNRPILRITVSKTTLISNGVDEIVLSGLPVPCDMIRDPGEPEEERVTVTGGGFIFTAENPGKYQFRIERFPFLPLNLEFTAT